MKTLLGSLLLVMTLAGAAVAAPDAGTVAVIGTGRVGGALGPQFAKLGWKVVYGSRTPADARVAALVAKTNGSASAASPAAAAASADIVVLAVPWSATEATVRGLGDLAGKIVMDATNPFRFGKDKLMEIAVDTSGGELVQSWAPQAKVVKAFNAVGYSVMADPASAGGPVTIPLAGDDDAAKARVAKLVQAMGFETLDAGPLRHARHLEGMAVIYLTPYLRGHPEEGFEYYLRKRGRAAGSPAVRPAG